MVDTHYCTGMLPLALLLNVVVFPIDRIDAHSNSGSMMSR